MLTPKQLSVLRYLAVGSYSNRQICEELQITPACFYVHCQHIRKRTGITDTKNARQCATWLAAHPEAKRRANLPTVPTRRQFEILEKYGAGKDLDKIASEMGLKKNTVATQLSAARIRAGITGPAFADKRKQVRDYLERVSEKVTMNDSAFQ